MEQLLIIDDSIVQGTALQRILEHNYHVETCFSGQEGLEVAKTLQPSLVLLDVIMPKLDGFQVLSLLKQEPLTTNIPVILITSLSDVGNEEKGLTMGAVDYIVKPFNPAIVQARVRTHTQLYSYRKAIENLVRLDGLTGIANRRCYDERCQEEWHRAIRQKSPLSFGLLDIDFFKQFNDQYGHPSGDDALRRVATAMTQTLRRSSDFVARYGGEEFAFLLPDTPKEPGQRLAEAICQSVAALGIPHTASKVQSVLTVSIGGLTVLPLLGQEYQDFFQVADNMLYLAKKSGRNTVVWADSLSDLS